MRPRSWSLARQLLILQVVVVTVVVVAAVAAAYVQARSVSQDSARQEVLAVARAVAAQPQVRDALAGPDPASVLQPLAERVRADTGTDFVVVMSPDRTRYSHPNPALVGRPFLGHVAAALRGGTVLETYTGTLGPSERAVVPVRTSTGAVSGLVAVGIRREALSRELSAQLPTLVGAGVVALLLSGVGSALVARRLRRQTHGLGPAELTRMYEFYDAVCTGYTRGCCCSTPGAGSGWPTTRRCGCSTCRGTGSGAGSTPWGFPGCWPRRCSVAASGTTRCTTTST